jgi:hypothetical protein
MPITLTPITPATDLIDTARASQNDALAALASSNADQLAALITAASDAIRKSCMRDFTLTDYTEYHSGAGYPNQLLQTREYPITAVSRVATSPTPVLTIVNTSTANQRATVATTSTGLSLKRVASGVSTTSTLAYASYVTLTALADAVNALANGWTATVSSSYGLWPSADLKPLQGAMAAVPRSGGAVLEMYLEELSIVTGNWSEGLYGSVDSGTGWRQDEETGQLFGWFPRGTMNIRVDYTAGYATIPEPIQQACVFLAADMYAADKRDGSLRSASLGPYKWEVMDTTKLLTNNPKVKALIYPYSDPSKLFGRHG